MTSLRDPSPNDFCAAFLAVVGRKRAVLLESWLNNANHTTLMCGKVIPDIARELGLSHSRDYYGIDAILYHEKDTINFPDLRSTYAKYISVAIEHENDYWTSTVEMNKLQLLNVPLTVLITYPPNRKTAANWLERYASIIHGGDILQNASTRRRQLAIFGYPGPEWDAFLYEGRRFIPLEVAKASASA